MPGDTPNPILSERFERALVYAVERHRHQSRNGTEIPYVSHLLQVSGIVLEAGGDEDQAIAGLLHDAIEDAPAGEADTVRREILERFGERVLALVEACTDADTQPKPPWGERKCAYLEHLKTVEHDALLVSAADKLHNARAILRDYRAVGDALWCRFAGDRDGTLWYYRALVTRYGERGGVPLAAILDQVVTELEHAVEGAAGPDRAG